METYKIVKKSQNDFQTTYDRLRSFIMDADGIHIFLELDHSHNAHSVNKKLNPSKLMLIGNPGLTTVLMQFNPNIGIDLPMRLLVFEDSNGDVYISYTDPELIRKNFNIRGNKKLDETIDIMKGALDQITDVVISNTN